MITVTEKNGMIKKFNLKNHERERALYSAWYAMQNDPKYKEKAFNITTDKNEKLHMRIQDIIIAFDDSFFVDADVRDVKNRKRAKAWATH